MYRLGTPLTENFMAELESKNYIRNKQFQPIADDEDDLGNA